MLILVAFPTIFNYKIINKLDTLKRKNKESNFFLSLSEWCCWVLEHNKILSAEGSENETVDNNTWINSNMDSIHKKIHITYMYINNYISIIHVNLEILMTRTWCRGCGIVIMKQRRLKTLVTTHFKFQVLEYYVAFLYVFENNGDWTSALDLRAYNNFMKRRSFLQSYIDLFRYWFSF